MSSYLNQLVRLEWGLVNFEILERLVLIVAYEIGLQVCCLTENLLQKYSCFWQRKKALETDGYDLTLLPWSDNLNVGIHFQVTKIHR